MAIMCVGCIHPNGEHDFTHGCRRCGCNRYPVPEPVQLKEESMTSPAEGQQGEGESIFDTQYQKDSTGAWGTPSPDQRDGNVGELIDGRVDVYGDPAVVFVRQAQIFSAILGVEVQPWQVALLMVGYKLVRTSVTPDYSDNSDDIDGYLDIFKTIIGDDMVHARDTKDYIAQGGAGARSVTAPRKVEGPPIDWSSFIGDISARKMVEPVLDSGDELSREEMQRLVYLCNKAGSFQTEANRELFDFVEQMFKARLC